MKTLKPFFDTIGQTMIFDEDQMLRFARLGIDPSAWPNSQKNAVLVDFLEKLDKGYWVARQSALNGPLDTFSEMVLLPENDAELKDIYFKNLSMARAVDLSDQLRVYPQNAFELIENFKNNNGSEVKFRSQKQSAEEHLKILNDRIGKKESIVSVNGWERLSSLIGGFNPGRVTLVSALTGFGKTNLALNIATSASETMCVGMVNMEMTEIDLLDRIIAIESRATHEKVRVGDVDWSKIIDLYSGDKTERLFITDGKNLSIDQIYSFASTIKQKYRIGLLFIDYDQKIDLHIDYKTPEWKAMQLAVHAIETMAKDLSIHIIMLSQANDEGTPSGSRRSTYPASAVLWFTKTEEGKFILKPIKNRFGPTSKSVELEYKPEMSLLSEKGIYEHTGPRTSAIRFEGTGKRKQNLF